MIVWQIQALETAPNENGKSDVVKIVHWTVDLFEDGDSVNFYGTVELDPPKRTFTAFNDLTEEQVIKWIKAKLDLTEIETILMDKMAIKKNPPIEKKTPPWNVAKETSSGFLLN